MLRGLPNKLGKDKHPLGKTKPQLYCEQSDTMSIIYNECIIMLEKIKTSGKDLTVPSHNKVTRRQNKSHSP